MTLVGGCYTVEDLLEKVRTSANLTAWLAYVELRQQEEEKRLADMMGATQQGVS